MIVVKKPSPFAAIIFLTIAQFTGWKKTASFATSSKQGEFPLDFKRNLFGSMISFLRMLRIVGTQLNGYLENGLPFIPGNRTIERTLNR